jgi:hypothetical protein
MTLSQFEQRTHRNPAEFGGISSDRLIWVVTVHASMWTDGSPSTSPLLKQAYTILFDAASHTGFETCIGCATLG